MRDLKKIDILKVHLHVKFRSAFLQWIFTLSSAFKNAVIVHVVWVYGSKRLRKRTPETHGKIGRVNGPLLKQI